jgi:amino acid transporter
MSGSNEDLFWSLFAFSAVIFLLPYQGMLLTFLKLRRVDADHYRPYRVPGGTAVARVAAGLCMTILALSIFLFLYTPGSGFEWAVVAGVVVTLLIGEVVIRFAENHRKPS